MLTYVQVEDDSARSDTEEFSDGVDVVDGVRRRIVSREGHSYLRINSLCSTSFGCDKKATFLSQNVGNFRFGGTLFPAQSLAQFSQKGCGDFIDLPYLVDSHKMSDSTLHGKDQGV